MVTASVNLFKYLPEPIRKKKVIQVRSVIVCCRNMPDWAVVSRQWMTLMSIELTLEGGGYSIA